MSAWVVGNGSMLRPGRRETSRCVPAGARSLRCLLEKHQIAKRLTQPFLLQTLDAFQRGDLDALAAAELLSISRAPLFRLRAARLQQPVAFSTKLSGGNHRTLWPVEVQPFLQSFLPLQRPPNFQLVADELTTRFAFRRNRKSVAASARRHFPLLVNTPAPTPKPRRRWQRARVGELWQPDTNCG